MFHDGDGVGQYELIHRDAKESDGVDGVLHQGGGVLVQADTFISYDMEPIQWSLVPYNKVMAGFNMTCVNGATVGVAVGGAEVLVG